MILHRLALTATILTLDQKPCLKVIAYFYFYSTIQVKFLGRLDHGKRDVLIQNKWNRTERDEQPDQYKYIPYRAGPYGSISTIYWL